MGPTDGLTPAADSVRAAADSVRAATDSVQVAAAGLPSTSNPAAVLLSMALFALPFAVETDPASTFPAEGDTTSLKLVENGRTDFVVAVSETASATEVFAASELESYLLRMSGATFPLMRGPAPNRAIVLGTAPSSAAHRLPAEDSYVIAVRESRIYLTGGSPRAVLYAAYDLLERLGCRFLAPDFELYEGTSEFIPTSSDLSYTNAGDVVERPVFPIRKLDTAGARSHTAESVLKQLDWMAKRRFNTLMVSIRAGLGGETSWDDWRADIVPELEKRGMLLQVGGHGYQLFLNAEMDDGALFERHPDWFGRDAACAPRREAEYVFNTGSEEAVSFLVGQVLAYLEAHPEIDIFGFWPPDLARWDECSVLAALGSPGDRQARLVGRLHEAIDRAGLDVRLEMIAYEHALDPPSDPIPAGVLVDFCPLAQNFDVQIYDARNANNRVYADALQAWRRAFTGSIGLYSYYRKYAWRSLPNVIPHYLQRDLAWYASVPIDAVSSYAEPADWFTYELNHLVFGELAWDPAADVERLIDAYADVRFGTSAGLAREVVTALEEGFRPHASLPYFERDDSAAIAAAWSRLSALKEAVDEARPGASDGRIATNLDRLSLMLSFALRDLEIQRLRAEGAPADRIEASVADLVEFLTENRDRGTFLVYGGNDMARYLRHYTRDWSEVAPVAAERTP